MNYYKDLDTLYDFLKSIDTIEEFFTRKEPCFTDETSRQYAQWSIDNGGDADDILSALKSAERQRFAELQQQRALPN